MQNKVIVSKGWQLELFFYVYRTQLLDCSVGDVDLIVKEVKYLWCSPRGLLVVLTTATWVPAFTLFCYLATPVKTQISLFPSPTMLLRLLTTTPHSPSCRCLATAVRCLCLAAAAFRMSIKMAVTGVGI